MKKTLLILLLSISSLAFSQNYQGYVPFPDSNAVWIDDYESQYGATNRNICSTRQLSLGGDTIINTKRYVTVNVVEEYWSHNSISFPCTWGSYNVYNYVYGFLRNDTLDKKVWIQRYHDSTEQVLYDFDLNLGDTLDQTFTNRKNVTDLVVDSIDTVFIANKYRKRFWLEDTFATNSFSQTPIKLIEGIGSNRGFYNMEPPVLVYYRSNLMCMALNGNTVYPDTSISCQLITKLGENFAPKKEIQLYPNPTAGIVNLTFKKELQNIEIYNLQGQKVQEINPKNRSWELPEQSGLYLIRLQDEEGEVYTEKIIRN